jgi:nitrite reductase/ring-hydroxylating ferredoxin subunit/uncharacterized membrane protein
MAGLKEFLEGKPFRTPLHPALVHLPIALFPLSLILDAASWIVKRGDVPLVTAAFICLVGGIATALVAAIFGFVDYTDIRDDHPAKKTTTAHMVLNLVAVGLYAGSAGLRYASLSEPKTALLPLVISAIATAILSYSGYLGGVLVYDDGVGVGRHRHRGTLPEKTIVVRTAGGQPAAVASESALANGQTLRVEVDGKVAMLARCNGVVYAVQEFCTHRYGPLSEGHLGPCDITCPWHGSKFDLKTGKVLEGPAKVDLRTFKVEVRDGKIWIYPAAV